MSAQLLALRGLTKRYPGTLAVDAADIVLSESEVVGLVGKNGAGKSTLIKMVAGVEKADEGNIVVDGLVMPRNYDSHMARRNGFSFVFQELEVVPELSIAENILMGNRYPRSMGVFISWRAVRQAVVGVMKQFGLHRDPQENVSELRSAEQRLVMIARAMFNKARLLVLDEPSASLAENDIRLIFKAIRELRSTGCSVVYISHRLHEVLEIADRVVVMRDGAVVGERFSAGLEMHELVGMIAGSDASPDMRSPSGGIRVPPLPREACLGTECLLDVDGILGPGLRAPISFSLRRGEVLGIGGLVGAGRTELVRLIVGADRRRAGSVTVKGRRVRVRGPRDAMRAGIALLPEDRRREGLILDLSLRENVTMADLERHRTLPWLPVPSLESERRAARTAMERLHIVATNENQTVGSLSGGNQQKVVVAKWMELSPEVFIMDEPTQGIDVQAKEEVFALIQSLAAGGKGVIFISSDFQELVRACDRVIILREGIVAGELESGDLCETAIVERCYEKGAEECILC